MPTKDPNNWESFLRWLPLVIIGLFAGVAKYASDIQAGKLHFSVGLFLCQVLVSMFAGWIGGLLCLSSGLSLELTCVGAGLAGYGGGAVLNAIWRGFFASKLAKMELNLFAS